eukprot:5996058-Amphidinium_carterae.3
MRRKLKGSPEKPAVFSNLASGCWWAAQRMHRKGRIYTDGSDIHPLDLQSRRAGWAVVSLNPDGTLCKAQYGAVPLMASVMQTSRDAEDMAFAVVLADHGENERHRVGVDCQGTITRARARPPRHVLAKDVRSHLWINVGFVELLDVHKVKAHRHVHDRMNFEEKMDTVGNSLADHYAKLGTWERVRGGAFRAPCNIRSCCAFMGLP